MNLRLRQAAVIDGTAHGQGDVVEVPDQLGAQLVGLLGEKTEDPVSTAQPAEPAKET